MSTTGQKRTPEQRARMAAAARARHAREHGWHKAQADLAAETVIRLRDAQLCDRDIRIYGSAFCMFCVWSSKRIRRVRKGTWLRYLMARHEELRADPERAAADQALSDVMFGLARKNPEWRARIAALDHVRAAKNEDDAAPP